MFDQFSQPDFWTGLLQIIGVNVVLSGDNAVVIALAARSLPKHQQRRAIVWGSVAAIVLRIVLTLAAARLLELPWLKLIGSLLLFSVGGGGRTSKVSRSTIRWRKRKRRQARWPL